MKINSNIQAQIANSVLKANEEKYSKSTEKLSSGYKLNHASDSPSGMAISNKMNAQIRSLTRAKSNASNAINAVQTADGALNEVHDMLQRMNELSIKAANGTMSSSDRMEVQEEIKSLKKEIDRVAADTEYNTQNLLGGEQGMKGYVTDSLTSPATLTDLKVVDYDIDFPYGKYYIEKSGDDYTISEVVEDAGGVVTYKEVDGLKSVKTEDEKITVSLNDGSRLMLKVSDVDKAPASAYIELTGIGGMKIQVGSQTGQEIQVVIPKMDTESMGIDKLDLTTEESATEAIDKISAAIEYVSRGRSQLGAYQNRLEHTEASLAESIENLTESYSTIKDVDMAEEMVDYTTLQVLVQAGTSMLTQANEQPQQALQLLQ